MKRTPAILAQPIPADEHEEAAHFEKLFALHEIPEPFSPAAWEKLAKAQTAALASELSRRRSRKRPAARPNPGKPPMLNKAWALLFAHKVFDLMDKQGMSEREACKQVWGRQLRNEVCKLGTFLKQVNAFSRMRRGKLVKDDKFKAKLDKDRERVVICAEVLMEHSSKHRDKSEAIIKELNQAVDEFLA